MMTNGGSVWFRRSAVLGRYGLPKSPAFKTHLLLLDRRFLDSESERVNARSLFMVASASSSASASVGGSDAEYSGKLLRENQKQKGKRIAGIDQGDLLDPALLADPDSCFCEFEGVRIHHKICDAERTPQNLLQDQTNSQNKRNGLPMILLHGLGASVFSWHRVMKPLAQATGSKILAFDRPAFGLTTRVNLNDHLCPYQEEINPLNPYFMIFSVLATLYFIDSLPAEKAVLIGHSIGSRIAVNTYFQAPERVAALVLVAPAILAPLASHKVVQENRVERDAQLQEDRPYSYIHANAFIRFCNLSAMFTKYIVQAITLLVKGTGDILNSLHRKALSALLRSAFALMLIRVVVDKFSIAAVRNAWYNSNQVTEHVLHGYTKPLRAKGWDKALAEYAEAMLTDSWFELKPSIVDRLKEVSCPVLIVTGDGDRLIPSWNARKLSQAIPGSFLEVIQNCGHLPHEEKAEEFVSVVNKFLQIVSAGNSSQGITREDGQGLLDFIFVLLKI
ncbi:2,6-dioxo-6-phenylhexa-3-enoate hydrolase [Bertholletia excelsa]